MVKVSTYWRMVPFTLEISLKTRQTERDCSIFQMALSTKEGLRRTSSTGLVRREDPQALFTGEALTMDSSRDMVN